MKTIEYDVKSAISTLVAQIQHYQQYSNEDNLMSVHGCYRGAERVVNTVVPFLVENTDKVRQHYQEKLNAKFAEIQEVDKRLDYNLIFEYMDNLNKFNNSIVRFAMEKTEYNRKMMQKHYIAAQKGFIDLITIDDESMIQSIAKRYQRAVGNMKNALNLQQS